MASPCRDPTDLALAVKGASGMDTWQECRICRSGFGAAGVLYRVFRFERKVVGRAAVRIEGPRVIAVVQRTHLTACRATGSLYR
ncbi:hypothetical protein G6F60_014940 [Rhizopus arrhizus]|nr:hypothetical protein G6F31_020308 [Rhizopus arrhizus]KAG1385165.1 hypothetical protein G6F60_014940 [Rhizopus arrhizus]